MILSGPLKKESRKLLLAKVETTKYLSSASTQALFKINNKKRCILKFFYEMKHWNHKNVRFGPDAAGSKTEAFWFSEPIICLCCME